MVSKGLCSGCEVWEFTYLGDKLSVDGGCEAAVTDIARCGCVGSCCMAGDFL